MSPSPPSGRRSGHVGSTPAPSALGTGASLEPTGNYGGRKQEAEGFIWDAMYRLQALLGQGWEVGMGTGPRLN